MNGDGSMFRQHITPLHLRVLRVEFTTADTEDAEIARSVEISELRFEILCALSVLSVSAVVNRLNTTLNFREI
jgi:hypothetical protein